MLGLLQHAWQHTESVSTHELSTLLYKLARSAPVNNSLDMVVTWASDAAMKHIAPFAKREPADAPSSSTPATAQSNTGRIPEHTQQAVVKLPEHCPDACLDVLIRLCKAESRVKLSAIQSLLKLTQSASAIFPHQLVALAKAACHSLTDQAELVAQASIQLLVALSVPTSHAILSSADEAAHYEAPWRQQYALQPQQIAFQPEQLAELLSWLRQASPLVLSQPSQSPSTAAATDDQLQALIKGCQTINTSGTFPGYAPSPLQWVTHGSNLHLGDQASTYDVFTSLQIIWHAAFSS